MVRILYLGAAILTFNIQLSIGQIFSIGKVERIADNVVLHYDLIDTVSARAYTINLYASTDQYLTPLENVTGDVGLEIKPGADRQIIWNAKKGLGATFAGDVRLEVRGRVYIPFVKLDGFKDYKTFKRKRTYRITWTGGRGNNVLNFDLYKGDKKITSYPNIANVGYYNLKFNHVRPGKNYFLKISDSKNKDEVVYSERFRIKRKVPLLLKLIPLAAGAYAVYYLSGESGDSQDGEIVDPPVPDG